MESRINLRVDNVNSAHVHCSLFMNNAFCGRLTFTVGEYQLFGVALLLGCKHTGGRLIDESDESVFIEWAEGQAG